MPTRASSPSRSKRLPTRSARWSRRPAAVAGDLAKGAISQEELDAARTPVLASADQAQRDNGAWASVMRGSTRGTGAIGPALRELTGRARR